MSNTKINNWDLVRLQINHQKNTFCLKNESKHLLLLGRSKMFDSTISKRLIKDLHFIFFINSHFMLHNQWNVEKTQVTPTKPTLFKTRGLLWMQINVHTVLKKCTHHLHKTTRPRIHATNNRHTLRWTVRTKLFSHNAILTNRHRDTIRWQYQQDIKQLLIKV